MEKGLDVNLGTDRIKWHPKTHTELMPCDSFGEILFRGFGSQADNSPVCACVCVCVWEREWVCMCVCVCVNDYAFLNMCVCVCVND